MSGAYSISDLRVATTIDGIKKRMKPLNRRDFLKSTSTAIVAGTVLGQFSMDETRAAENEPTTSRRLSNWDYRRGSLGGPWEAWRKASDDANKWSAVQVPHS